MSELTLVVPVYNEASRIDPVPWLEFLSTSTKWALSFIDDGSTDTTIDALEALQSRAPNQIGIKRLPGNCGKAEAVRSGIVDALAAESRYVGFIDADLSAPLSEVASLQLDLDQHPDAWAAFGSRVKLLGRHIDRSSVRHYLGRIFATCASLALQLPVYDTQCGLKLFRNTASVRDAFAAPFHSRWIFDVELLARLADAADDVGARVREVPLERWAERGASRLRLRDFFVAPFELARIRRDRRHSA